MIAAKTILILALCSTLAAAQYVEPDWWPRIASEDTTGTLRRCARKVAAGVLPVDGSACSLNPKICFFDTQQCTGVGPHPVTKCDCDNAIWDCDPEPCPPPPVGGCASQADCAGFELCFAEDDSFCGICQPSFDCSTDTDCLGSGSVCDDRRQTCLCSGGGLTCNAACASSADCGLGDICSLPDGHCVPTTCLIDATCIDHFACSSAGGTECERRTCLADPDCIDGGFCVKGKCYAERGFCSPPPP